ncbi:CAP-Gly domain family protein [Candida albicans]|uniref:CAP-Gly domain family protein n=1 Tax=Candida albicans TaxID=5476 RepID=A0A8H6F382_CANAX|nr:CAP-Gly domain family protein [Candida albicans]
MSFEIGQSVVVKNDIGSIKYIGTTKFAPGVWYGIELLQPKGKNNGSVQGVKYFDCKEDDNGFYGIFVKGSMLNALEDNKNSKSEDVAQYNKTIEKLKSKLKAVTDESIRHREKLIAIQSELQTKIEIMKKEKLRQLSVEHQELKNEFELIQEELEINREIEREMESLDSDHYSSETEIKLKHELEHLQSEQLNMNELQKKLDQAESVVRMLQERIETTEDMDKMMERLTVENEDLTNKIHTLMMTIDDLNEIHELDKKLEEDQKQVELDLRQEIDSLQQIIRQDKLKINELESNRLAQLPHTDKIAGLGQTISDLRLKSRSDSVQLKLVKARYEILQQRIVYSQASMKFPGLIDLIFMLKLGCSDIAVVKDSISLKSLHQLFANTFLSLIENFLKLLITLLEFNYSAESINELLSELTVKVKACNLCLGDIINVFLKITRQHLDITVTLDLTFSAPRFVYECKECLKLVASSSQLETSFFFDVWKHLRLQTNNADPTITALIKEGDDNLARIKGQVEALKDISHVEEGHDVTFSSAMPDFKEMVSQIGILVKLYDLVKSDGLDINVDSLNKMIELTQVVESLYNLDTEVHSFEITVPSIYEYKSESILQQPSIDDGGLQNKLAQREREVTDLKLNIALLEQNMSSLASQNTQYITELTQKLQSLKKEEEDSSRVISQLEQDKKDLVSELNAVNRNTVSTTSFANLKSQQDYNNSLTIMEKIVHLKRLTKTIDKEQVDDFAWLQPQSKRQFWTEASSVHNLSKSLQSLALNAKPKITINTKL